MRRRMVGLGAAAAVLEIPIKSAVVSAEGDVDLRGTLGVTEGVPVGFKEIRLRFELESDASDEELKTLERLTERYCVVLQTLASRFGETFLPLPGANFLDLRQPIPRTCGRFNGAPVRLR